MFTTPSVELYMVIGSRSEFAAGNWAAYRAQDAFALTEEPALSRARPAARDRAGGLGLPAWRGVVCPGVSDFSIVDPHECDDVYAGSDVPGEFRPLTDAAGARQLALTLIHVPPHSDFEQGTGHFHDEIEEIYLVTRGTLTMRFGDEVRTVTAPAVVRVAPQTARSHRNEGDEPVDMYAISRQLGRGDATKIDAFWEASPQAAQKRG